MKNQIPNGPSPDHSSPAALTGTATATKPADSITEWFPACGISDVAENGGVCVKYKEQQIALFYFTSRNEWYATQNECPHKRQMALSRGMIGSLGGQPKIACPFHKKTFSLITGDCLNGEECAIRTYPVKIQQDIVYIGIQS